MTFAFTRQDGHCYKGVSVVPCLYNKFWNDPREWVHKFDLAHPLQSQQSHACSTPPTSLLSLQHIRAMDSQQILPQAPSYVKFRVLIIGRANAGKTSILQRVCDTTENPEIYNVDSSGVRSQVRSHCLWLFPSDHVTRFNNSMLPRR